jgi:hypothetical protein
VCANFEFCLSPKLPVEKNFKKTQVLTFLILLVKMHYKSIKHSLILVGQHDWPVVEGSAYYLSCLVEDYTLD